MKIGDKIIFTDENNDNEIEKEITDLKIFENFDSAIRNAKLKNILPGINTYKEGVKLYNSIPDMLSSKSKIHKIKKVDFCLVFSKNYKKYVFRYIFYNYFR